MNKKTVIISTLAFFLVPTAVLSEEQPPQNELPYSKLFPWMDLVVNERLDLFEASMKVRLARDAEGVNPADYSCTLVDGDTEYVFTVNASGTLDLPHRPDWNEAELVMKCNMGRDQVYIDYIPQPILPTVTKMRYRDLMEYVPQYIRYWKGLAETTGFGRPRAVNGVVLGFGPEGGRVTIHTSWGDEVLEADERGSVEMNVDYVLIAENPEIEFSQLPQFIYGS